MNWICWEIERKTCSEINSFLIKNSFFSSHYFFPNWGLGGSFFYKERRFFLWRISNARFFRAKCSFNGFNGNIDKFEIRKWNANEDPPTEWHNNRNKYVMHVATCLRHELVLPSFSFLWAMMRCKMVASLWLLSRSTFEC